MIKLSLCHDEFFLSCSSGTMACRCLCCSSSDHSSCLLSEEWETSLPQMASCSLVKTMTSSSLTWLVNSSQALCCDGSDKNRCHGYLYKHFVMALQIQYKTWQIVWNCVQTNCTVTSIWTSMWFISLINKINKLNIKYSGK